MGIDCLTKIFKKSFPQVCGLTIDIRLFKGLRIAVDTNNLMYRHYKVQSSQVIKRTNVVHDQVDYDQILRAFLQSMIGLINNFLHYGITPVFVFDGKPHRLKIEKELQKRKERKEKLETTHQELIKELENVQWATPDQVKKLQSVLNQKIGITHKEITIVKDILYALGIPYIQSKGEAEDLCSRLCREHLVNAVYSNDSDNLAFGCPLLIRDMGMRKYDTEKGEYYYAMDAFSLPQILSVMGINMNQFIDLCIFSGCDYNERLRGCGPVNIMEYMRSYEYNIDNMKGVSALKIEQLQYEECRKIFKGGSSFELLGMEEEVDTEDTTYPWLQPIKERTKGCRDTMIRYGLENHIDAVVSLINILNPNPIVRNNYIP
ncbi:Flap endonuclease 1 [Orpheovirus IHUMI-LCC2]|uniref:Flap endonuclease 1 n=1 Tax=Orpheovirus IHUMI-LCC2 TaxID=2023057 RepID=A0A2I2L4C8_9VIRU|nr:Flap endonuclease 1 [Orpheovirus IHUMI-LCC2]SNW62377.1 Flap endonuclease 1 [Orpheovirus IHUMI-LCC2]